jgi:4-hydroxy-3-methylbut-2-en-1-yl diphosphate reductase
MRVILAQPRGFCAGVVRAIEIVERALAKHGAPVYVRHEIVHNRHVVESLEAKGAIFVENLDEVPSGAVAIFSAHGVSREVERQADRLGIATIDATCPLVKKVHLEGQRYAAQGFEVVLIGHEGHAEVVGTIGQIDARVHLVATVEDVERLEVSDPLRLAYVTQTTLSVDETRAVAQALQQRFPAIAGPDTKDICYATQNRQMAVRTLAEHVEAMFVVGAANSSNANRLREIAGDCGVRGYLISDVAAVDWRWLADVKTLGITAGASAPDVLVDGLIAGLRLRMPVELTVLAGPQETVQFRLPASVA